MSKPSARETFFVFLRLGLTSFGGPVAHLGFFRREIVEKRKWLSDAAYADLVALCQFLPGPASSQVGFGLGYLRAGFPGALGALVGFTLPSALIMIACAYGMASIGMKDSWLHGLKVAAVAVVAQAVWSMAIKLCPDPTRASMALLAAALALMIPAPGMQILIIFAGLGIGWILFRNGVNPRPPDSESDSSHLRDGWFPRGSLVMYFVLLAGLPILAWSFPDRWLSLIDGFYRAGALVFGGGHVVLPLLEAETVGKGWLSRGDFLAGYGIAQAVPGPLFTLAAYLGAVMLPEGPGWFAGLIALTAILTPSLLLVIGVLPYWQKLRSLNAAQAALMGANAVVVGLLLAAFYNPVFTSAIDSPRSAAIALIALIALQFGKLPSWILVGFCALEHFK